MFDNPKDFKPFTTEKEEAPRRFRPLTDEEKEELGLEEETPKTKPPKKELPSASAKTKWTNPETQTEQEIEINFEESLAEQKTFYKEKLNIDLDEEKAKDIWNRNYTEIKAGIKIYGYDSILIIPDNLPEEEILNEKLIETMDEGPGKGKVNATYQSNNFRQGGSFAGIRNSYTPKYRLVLTHSVQNIYNNPNANPFLKATLGKNIMELSNLGQADIDSKISSGQEIKVDFKITINGQEIKIQSDGWSLEEYILQQSMYFEKTGKHLDESSWTWLIKSCSGSRVAYSDWSPDDRQLDVAASGPADVNDRLGLRLSRSFS